MRNGRQAKSRLTSLPHNRTQMVSKLLKRRAFGGHQEGVEDLDRNFVIFVNPCTPYFYAITHVIYTVPQKSPVTISYGDIWNKKAKANSDSKID